MLITKTVEDFALQAGHRLQKLHEALRSGAYRPRAARALRLEEDPGRPLVIPAVRDRVVQRALTLGLAPFYERQFCESVVAYRKGRGVDSALAAVDRALELGRRWYLRTDISKFFDRIERGRLLEMLERDGLDARTRELIDRLLRGGVERGAFRFESGAGTQQGSALSPLLANVYLRSVDRSMEASGISYLRYADDGAPRRRGKEAVMAA